MVTVQEIREKLVNEFQMDPEVVAELKGKTTLLDTLNSLSASSVEDTSIETLFGDLEEEIEEEEDTAEEDIPSYNSVEWSDYVMTQFQDDELVDGNPNINGLRRVVNELLGEVVKSVPTSVIPCMGGIMCTYEVSIIWGLTVDGISSIGDYGIKVFGGAADASENNTDRPYSNYLAAMAETRAEVRALRKALRLKGVAHEEVNNADKQEQIVTWDSPNAPVTGQQLALIKTKTESLGIDLDKMLEYYKTKGNITESNLDKLIKDDGSYLIQAINQYQTQHIAIPTEIQKG